MAIGLNNRRRVRKVNELVFFERRVAGFALAEASQHEGYEKDQQYGSQSYACAPTVTPAAMTVVASAAPKNQYQDNN